MGHAVEPLPEFFAAPRPGHGGYTTFRLGAMRTLLPTLICAFVCGCSPRSSPQQTGTSPKSFTFSDGSVMTVQKQDGVLLEGIRLVQKSPEGLQTCDAQKGEMTEDADHHGMHVTLYDASVVLPSKQRMMVHELKVGLVR
jgi:hypothetical protein